MKTRTIPRTNLNAAVLFLGTAGFGSALDDLVSVDRLKKFSSCWQTFEEPEKSGTLVYPTGPNRAPRRLDLLPKTKHGFAAFAYSPQANGYFRRLEQGTIDQASDLVKGLFHHVTNQRRYERIKELQQQTGYSQGQIVLGYLLSQHFPVFPIIGPNKIADLEDSLEASDITLTSEQLKFLTAEFQ
jgi:aryl-alcohol dehydrogenase-like predicted oxidoreductase